MTTKNMSLERAAQIVLFITLFLTPFFFIPSASVTVDTAKTLLLAAGGFIVFSLYVIAVVKKGEFDFPAHRALWAVVLIPAAFLASALLSGSVHLSLVGYNFEIGTAAFVALGFALLFLTAILFRSKERIFYAYTAFFVSFAIVALLALIKFFHPSTTLGALQGASASPVGSFTDLAVFFGASLVLVTMALEELALGALGKACLWLAFVVSLFGIAVTGVSLVWIALLIFSLVFLLYTFSVSAPVVGLEGSATGERRVSYAALALLILSLIFVFNPTVSTSGQKLADVLEQKFGSASLQVSPSFSATTQVIRPVLKDAFLFGSGPNKFDESWLMYKPQAVNGSLFWNTPFTYGIGLLPTFVSTTGAVGALLWLAFLVMFLLLGVRAVFARSEDRVGRFLTTSSFVLSLFLWALFTAYVPSKAVFAIAFFFTGLFFASASLSGVIPRRTILFRNSSKLAFIAVLLLVALLVGNVAFAYAGVKQSLAAIYFGKAQVAAAGGDLAAARLEAARAANLTGEDVYYNAIAQIGVARANQILNTATGTPETVKADFQSALSETIQANQAAVTARPGNYQNWISLGALYESLVPAPFAVQGAFESAMNAYQEALKRNPNSPEPLFLIARLEVANKNEPAARDYIKQALAKKPDYADAYSLLAQIEISGGHTAEAIKAAESLALLAPQNAGVFFELGVLKYQSADYQGALDALSRALAISPDYANAEYFYGLTLAKLTRTQDALATFQKLSDTNPDSAELKQIIANLGAGRDPLYKVAGSAPTDTTTPPITKTASH